MTAVHEQARWLRWVLADGPLPAEAVMEALASNGFDARNRWRLARAKAEAGVESRRAAFDDNWCWRLKADDTPLPGPPDTWAECNYCHWTAHLPSSTLPRPCFLSARCPGTLHRERR